MAIPSITYTFTNGTTADGTEVSQNFDDLVAALTDGTKSLTIDALTVAGTATLNGSVVLGNAAADTITWNGTAPSILLDNGATNGGVVNFNGGTTSFIKSSADGTDLSLGGFTNITLTAAGALGLEAGITATTANFSSTLAATSGTFTLGVSADYLTVTTDDTSAPAANYLYKANIPKAWAWIAVGLAGAATITDDHNVSSATWSANSLFINYDTDFANDTFFSIAENINSLYKPYISSQTTQRSVAKKVDPSDGSSVDWANGNECSVYAIGDQ